MDVGEHLAPFLILESQDYLKYKRYRSEKLRLVSVAHHPP